MDKFEETVKSETPVLVDFYGSWCAYCQSMMPAIDKIEENLKGKAGILKVDVDKEQELTDKYKVISVPTLILFKSGEILWRQTGKTDLHALQEKILAFINE